MEQQHLLMELQRLHGLAYMAPNVPIAVVTATLIAAINAGIAEEFSELCMKFAKQQVVKNSLRVR